MISLKNACIVLGLSASMALAAPCPQGPPEVAPPASSTVAAPAPTSTGTTSFEVWSAAEIQAAAPASDSCAESEFESCRTAEEAAPFINAAFEKYGFATAGEQAAIISLMAFETADFEFDVNVFPGRAGQGTRNMMMFPFILKYALDQPELVEQVNALAPDLTADTPAEELTAVRNETQNAIRALVLTDELSFGSAAWFLKTQCPPEIATALQSASNEAYDNYLTNCIFTATDPARTAGFELAKAAKGL